MNIIQVSNLTKQYDDKVILHDVNFVVPEKSFTVFRGPSGAGKSTLLNMIGGLEKPTSGQIIIDGKDINQLTEKERINFYRHEVGLIFQGFYLLPQLSLLENIMLPGAFAGIPFTSRHEQAEQLARILGISEDLNRLPKAVSGGQAERACIARALLLNPKIILADEPTANLDDDNAITVLNLLNNLREQFNITVIVSSHSENTLRFATQVVTITNQTTTVQTLPSNIADVIA